ncbi:MAG: outer membrane lipoprotein carrier protein LolA [Verrucomicrobiota bacterium]
MALTLCAATNRSANGAETNTVDAWLARQATILTWSADFTQTRALKTLTAPLKAQGRVWFAAPNRFRWELGSPPRTIALRQPDEMDVIYPLLKRAERYPLTGERAGQWGSALALLEAGFPRNRPDLEAKFEIGRERISGDRVSIDLKPRSLSARKIIPRIELVISSQDLSLLSTELEFPDGSTLRNDFANPQLNPTLDPELFQPDFKPEYKIVEPLKH